MQLSVDASSARANIRCAQYRYVEAGQDYNNAKKLASDFDLQFDEHSLHDYYSLIGRFSEAEPYMFELYKQYAVLPPTADAKEHHLGRARAASDLWRALRMQQRFDEALPYAEEAYALYQQYSGEQSTEANYALHRIATTLVHQGTDLARAQAIVEQVQEVYDKLYHKNHLNMGYIHSLHGSLAFRLGRAEEAYRYHEHATRILGEQLGSTCQPVLQAMIEQGLMGQQLNQAAPESNAFRHAPMMLAKVLKKKYMDFKNAFSVFSPVFQEALSVAAEALAAKGDYEEAAALAAKRAEYVRISNCRTAVRYSQFRHEPVAPADLPALLALLGEKMSLPTDRAQVTVQKIQLPFYQHGWHFYELHYHNTPQMVRRYVLSDGEKCYCINYKNSPIYKVNEQAAVFTADNAADYAMFFFDAVCGRHGFFYVLSTPQELPWQVDASITDEFKAGVAASLFPVRFIAETETHFVLRALMVFKNSIFDATINITRSEEDRGVIALSDERLVLARRTGELVVQVEPGEATPAATYTTLDGTLVQLAPDEQLLDTLPLCIDPDYEIPPIAAPEEETLRGRLIGIFTFGGNMLELIVPMTSDEDDLHQLLGIVNELTDRLATRADIKISELTLALQNLGNFFTYLLARTGFDEEDYRQKNINLALQTVTVLIQELNSPLEQT